MERAAWRRCRGLALFACLTAGVALAEPPTPSLQRAIELVDQFQDVQAEQMLRQLLRHPHPAAEQAMAHLQLGLIALNRARTEEARTEFRAALAISPIVELPFGSSPKARKLFDQVFRETPAAATEVGPTPPAPGPAATPVVVVGATEQATPSSASHVASITLGVAGLVLLGTGAGFGIIGESALGQAKSTQDVGKSQSLAQGVGTDWLVADIAYGVGGAAVVAAIITFFLERAPVPAVAIVPTSSGAVVSVGGRF